MGRRSAESIYAMLWSWERALGIPYDPVGLLSFPLRLGMEARIGGVQSVASGAAAEVRRVPGMAGADPAGLCSPDTRIGELNVDRNRLEVMKVMQHGSKTESQA